VKLCEAPAVVDCPSPPRIITCAEVVTETLAVPDKTGSLMSVTLTDCAPVVLKVNWNVCVP